MPDPAERFIEAATAPLADNAELQMMAAQELRAAIDNRPEAAQGDSLEQAAANLEQNARRRERWKAVLYAITAVVAILAAIPVASDSIRLRVGPWAFFFPVQKVAELLGPLTPSERLLLFGDLSQPKRAAALERLWESDRKDPALFAIYARASAAERKLPADFVKTADLIDPQNAWFRYLAAGVTGLRSVEETKVPYRVRKVNPNIHLLATAHVRSNCHAHRTLLCDGADFWSSQSSKSSRRTRTRRPIRTIPGSCWRSTMA